MSHARIENHSRRRFLRGAAGMTLAVYLPAPSAAVTDAASVFTPNGFLRIGADNRVTVISKHLEMGQGAYTGLATIVAEELDAAWSQVQVEAAPADASRYQNLFWGAAQGTGGSGSVANSWDQLRRAGAAARMMLLAAAAARWQVAPGEITLADGVATHAPSGRSASFGQLAQAAAAQPVPAEVKLKDPKDYKLIGRHSPRKDSVAKTTGSAVFTQDIHLSGMLTAMVAHPPRFGATVKSVDAARARKIKGVVDVLRIPEGVAVLARDTWSAKQGRDALQITWDDTRAFKLGSAQIMQRYHALGRQPGTPVRTSGDAGKAIASAARSLEAEYDFPFLAHAAMEPLNCVIRLGAEGCEVWNGAQMQTYDQSVLAKVFGLKPEQVRIHTLFAGGSFGRRASRDADYLLEAAHIVKASGARAPVKLVWTREDDMRAGHYRPMFHHRLRAGLAPDGKLAGWQHRLVGQSVLIGSAFEAFVKDGIDGASTEGAVNLPYAIADLAVELHTPTDIGVPVQWWRSVGSTHTAFSTECFIDELAQAAGQDPVAFRLDLLGGHPRHAAVLRAAAQQAGWGTALEARPGVRRGRGIAVHESFGSVVAQVVEVEVKPDGSYRLERVVCAVDCGIAVNPDIVRAQVEGSIGYALSAAMHGAITLTDGKVDQSNFHDYAPIRMGEMPQVAVHILPSTANPSGIGEPAVPPLAPALGNALAAATGQRLRSLPFSTAALALQAGGGADA